MSIGPGERETVKLAVIRDQPCELRERLDGLLDQYDRPWCPAVDRLLAAYVRAVLSAVDALSRRRRSDGHAGPEVDG